MLTSRRLFLGHLVAGLAATTHPLGALVRAGSSDPPPRVRIGGLRLVTSVPLDEMQAFYGKTLGFEVARAERSLEVRGASWSLTFDHAPDTAAHYHFAFNIPENQIRQAHDWSRARTELIRPPEHLRDEGLPADVVAFRHWNAHSVFFWDPAGNAVEFIARHTLSNASTRTFGVGSAERISEIGLVVNDVAASAGELKARLGLETYVSASPAFEPLGDEQTLLLIMKAGVPMAFGQGRDRNPYPTTVRLAERHAGVEFSLPGYPYILQV